MLDMKNLILKKEVKNNGLKVYTVVHNKEVIETRVSRNDYVAASVLFIPKEGYEVFFHSHTDKIGKGESEQMRNKRPECSIGVAYINE